VLYRPVDEVLGMELVTGKVPSGEDVVQDGLDLDESQDPPVGVVRIHSSDQFGHVDVDGHAITMVRFYSMDAKLLSLQPLGDQFIVLPDPDITHSPDGIELPRPTPRKTGEVLRCGPLVNPDIKPGTKVLWLYDPATRFRLDALDPSATSYVRLQELDLVGIITENGHVPPDEH